MGFLSRLQLPLWSDMATRGTSVQFSLYSKHATRVELLFFAAQELAQPTFVFQFEPLENKSGPIWHCRLRVDCVNNAHYYAYRIDGPPATPFETHAFDREKLLLDPYARSVYFPPNFSRDAAREPGPNIGRAPLALLDECQCSHRWSPREHVRHDEDLIIYEVHVKGFTRHSSSNVPRTDAGTFEGLIQKIPHLLALGVTAVEFMPIFQFDPQEGSCWGYMPLCFFAPHHAYSKAYDSCGQRREFLRMVDELHSAGIEVILDVVFNHTTEGDEDGPCYNLKGADNFTYYLPGNESSDTYANFSGCGNTLDTSNAATRRLIIDSMRYWASEMRVDGFRFDLASAFTRRSDGSINLDDPPLFAEIAGEPILGKMRLIAEPWDAGGNVQLGAQFPGMLWLQWNARYRDTLQRFVKGQEGLLPELMTRIYGSSDLFPDEAAVALHPFQSVNYIASHDGRTLYDLVSYDQKHNEANGHGNTDGPNEFSSNCGHEGNNQVPEKVMALRKQRIRSFFCLLMLSNGTPMFRMGDEFLHSQDGNNNPYNQDNETSWLDWTKLVENADTFEFFQNMIVFRKTHGVLSQFGFWRDRIQWFGPNGQVELHSQCLAYYLCDEADERQELYVMINGGVGDVEFFVQKELSGHWKIAIDTSCRDAFLSSDDGGRTQPYLVKAASIMVLVAQ